MAPTEAQHACKACSTAVTATNAALQPGAHAAARALRVLQHVGRQHGLHAGRLGLRAPARAVGACLLAGARGAVGRRCARRPAGISVTGMRAFQANRAREVATTKRKTVLLEIALSLGTRCRAHPAGGASTTDDGHARQGGRAWCPVMLHAQSGAPLTMTRCPARAQPSSTIPTKTVAFHKTAPGRRRRQRARVRRGRPLEEGCRRGQM
jgi:hypothetical protein